MAITATPSWSTLWREVVLTWRSLAPVLFIAAFVYGMFAIAGRWDWTAGWAYIAIVFGGMTLSDVFVWMKNPELLVRRGQYGAGTKPWDIACLSLFGLPFLMTIVVGALDAGRHAWSAMPALIWYVGVLLFIAGQLLVTWAMRVNPFFEKTARIQKDRNQKVIDRGPYQYVRHPGYVGTIVGLILGTPLLLGSWLALMPAALSIISLIVRTRSEDRMLRQELTGYEAYCSRVRFRLVPLVW